MALLGFQKLCFDGNFDEVRQRINTLLPCVDWLDPNFKITLVADSDDDSDSYSGSECDDDMGTTSDNDAPNLVNTNQRPQRSRPQTDEDGWTTIPSRRQQ